MDEVAVFYSEQDKLAELASRAVLSISPSMYHRKLHLKSRIVSMNDNDLG